MSKAVLISTRPEWCENIANGEKTIEVRKTRPKLTPPFKCYIYMTKQKKGEDGWLAAVFAGNRCYYGAGSVIGEFVCDEVYEFKADNDYEYGIYDIDDDFVIRTCLKNGALWDYGKGAPLYGWHVSNFKIYDTPKELSEFHRKCEVMPCEGCEHLKWQHVNSDEYEYECEYLERLPLRRPPQSWCYVEEIGGAIRPALQAGAEGVRV